VDVIDNVVLH